MPESDSLAALAAELRVMSPRARRAILRSLSATERDALASHIGNRSGEFDRSAALNQPPALFSPWLATIIREAREEGGDQRITRSVRETLLRCSDRMTSGNSPASDPVPEAGRSLLGAFGGFMAPRGARR